jgi:hypothetical protein
MSIVGREMGAFHAVSKRAPLSTNFSAWRETDSR